MMETEILKMDQRGRIVIPKTMRKILNLDEHSRVMAIADPEKQEIRIIPFLGGEETVTIRVTMRDVPGSLGKIAQIFGEMNLNLLWGHSIILKRGEVAEWTVICPIPDNVETLRRRILEEGNAEDVEIIQKEA